MSILIDLRFSQPANHIIDIMSFLDSFKRLHPARVLSRKEKDDVRRQCGRFRVLIIGRANAGKTTILNSVCGTKKDPVIYDSTGKKVGTLRVNPTTMN